MWDLQQVLGNYSFELNSDFKNTDMGKEAQIEGFKRDKRRDERVDEWKEKEKERRLREATIRRLESIAYASYNKQLRIEAGQEGRLDHWVQYGRKVSREELRDWIMESYM